MQQLSEPTTTPFLFTAVNSVPSSSSASVAALVAAVNSGTERTSGMSAAAEDRTIAALRNHKEAEKRRRERINLHLDRLRDLLLPCNSKTDKATLLTKAVQRVRELKNQLSEMTELDCIPQETDDFAVTAGSDEASDNGKFTLRAYLCCDDRADLLPELIATLHSLRLKTVRAKICSIGGRVCSILMVTGDIGGAYGDECVTLLKNALRGIMERSRENSDPVKRRRKLHPLDLPL